MLDAGRRPWWMTWNLGWTTMAELLDWSVDRNLFKKKKSYRWIGGSKYDFLDLTGWRDCKCPMKTVIGKSGDKIFARRSNDSALKFWSWWWEKKTLISRERLISREIGNIFRGKIECYVRRVKWMLPNPWARRIIISGEPCEHWNLRETADRDCIDLSGLLMPINPP
jgi:hypothetical protein